MLNKYVEIHKLYIKINVKAKDGVGGGSTFYKTFFYGGGVSFS